MENGPNFTDGKDLHMVGAYSFLISFLMRLSSEVIIRSVTCRQSPVDEVIIDDQGNLGRNLGLGSPLVD